MALKTAMKADIPEIPDRQEAVSLMEPMRISEGSRHREALTDLTIELAAHAAGFRRSVPEGVLDALADLVRTMNCYYSNLIEGHDTHPVDIERAIKNDYSTNTEKRKPSSQRRQPTIGWYGYTPLPGWQWPCGAADVSCNAIGRTRQWRNLVHCPWPCEKRALI